MNMIRIIAWFYWLFNLIICSTLKYKIIDEPAHQAIFALWHGQTFPLFFWAQHRKFCIFPTAIWRGEIITYLAEKHGHRTVRFIEKGTPLEIGKALFAFIKNIREGCDAAIAVDGPPKPLHRSVKPGILFLSQKTGIPIVPAGINMKRKVILFWRWDRYEIPLPWSEVEIKFGKPFIADEKTTTQELEELLLQLSPESESAAS